MGPEPAPCTRFSHFKSGQHLLPPGHASKRLASAHALTPPLAPSPHSTPTPHSLQPPLPSPQPFFWPLFSSPPSFSEGTNLPVLVATITFLKKISSSKRRSGIPSPHSSTSAFFHIFLLPLAIKERGKTTSQRSLLVSGFSTHSCSILQRSPGHLVCGCELFIPPCLRFSASSMN